MDAHGEKQGQNGAIRLNDERRLQQVEGESWTSWRIESLDEPAYMKTENQEQDRSTTGNSVR